MLSANDFLSDPKRILVTAKITIKAMSKKIPNLIRIDMKSGLNPITLVFSKFSVFSNFWVTSFIFFSFGSLGIFFSLFFVFSFTLSTFSFNLISWKNLLLFFSFLTFFTGSFSSYIFTPPQKYLIMPIISIYLLKCNILCYNVLTWGSNWFRPELLTKMASSRHTINAQLKFKWRK